MATDNFWPAEFRPFEWAELTEGIPEPAVADAPDGAGGAVAVGPSSAELAAAVLSAAREEAEGLLAAARKEAEGIREAARREGIRQGREEGRQSLEEAANRWQATVQELAGYKQRLYEEARAQVVELAVAIAQKVLGPLAELDAEAVARVAGRAVALLTDREILTVRIHPEDLQALLHAKPRLLQSLDGIKKLTVVEDHSVARGGCLVETPTAEIDARLEVQLQELARTLKKPG